MKATGDKAAQQFHDLVKFAQGNSELVYEAILAFEDKDRTEENVKSYILSKLKN